MTAKRWRPIQRVFIVFGGLWIVFVFCGPVILHHLRLQEIEWHALHCGERERDLWDRMAAQRICEQQIETETNKSGYESSYGTDKSTWWWKIVTFALLPPGIVFALLGLANQVLRYKR